MILYTSLMWVGIWGTLDFMAGCQGPQLFVIGLDDEVIQFVATIQTLRPVDKLNAIHISIAYFIT